MPRLVSLALGISLVASLAPLGRAASAQGDREEDEGTRFFALPMVRETRELADLALEHLAAGRETEALAVLQRMLDEHSREVLAGAGSQYAHHSGVSEWALERLFALAPETHALYRARYGARAADALAHARAVGERALLIQVASRWPLVPAAVESWISLGDLEQEAGDRTSAALAYRKAEDLAARLSLDAPPLAERRARLEIAPEAARAPALPRRDASPWKTTLDLAPFGPRGGSPMRNNLFPVLAGDRLLVSSTLRVYALDPFTGDLRWQAGPPRGWAELGARASEDLFVGLNSHLVQAPAAGSGVVVAALQAPFSEFASDGWQGIEIMKAIPERRLHAFDLVTGKELWNHQPRLEFDGLAHRWDGGGSYAQRMMVAGPPVIAGARVLVPSYRMQGRIDYHVACYELESGELLWSTQLISGQRARNMFGRSQEEFCASPVVVSGARVVAQTELGTVAALDLFTGRILWATTYRQIEIPRTRVYQPAPRPVTWRLAPPIVSAGLVLTTPNDSKELLALELESGKLVWAHEEDALQRLDGETQTEGFNVLVGADDDTVYLSGGKLSALQKPGGLAGNARFVPRWTNVLGRVESSPRAVLAGDTLLAPSSLERTAFERRTGGRIEAWSGDWNGGDGGNLWLADGALFSLSATGVSGYFDWQTLLERARMAAREAGAGEPLERAGELFLRRGRLLAEGGEQEAARAVLSEAGSWFAAVRAGGGTPRAGAELECALALAEALTATGRERSALETLVGARAFVHAGAEEAELLFLEERILHRTGGAERVQRLDDLAARHGARALPLATARVALAEWLAGRRTSAEPEAPVPAFAWARLERAGERVRTGELGAALEDLHEVLATTPTVALTRGIELADVARERIARVLALPGGAEAHAPWQERASRALQEARDDDALARVQALFPHTRAAEEVLALRIERALAARDVEAVAELVAASLARATLAPGREEELFLTLARLLAELGNADYERGLLAALARRAPERRSPLSAHAGRTFAELAAERGNESAPSARPTRFTQAVVSGGKVREGVHQYLGLLTPGAAVEEGTPRELALYWSREGLVAFDSDTPGRPAWSVPLELPSEKAGASAVFPPGAVVVAARDRLLCLDARGKEVWSRTVPTGAPRRLALAQGVIVGLAREGRVHAFDARFGLALWSLELGDTASWTGPLLDGEAAVFLSQSAGESARVHVADLFLGRTRAEFALPPGEWKGPLDEVAWLSAGRLVVPTFSARTPKASALAAFDLADGRRAWSLSFPAGEELVSLARHGGATYPVTLAANLGPGGASGAVHLLDEKSGSLRRIAPLKPGEKLMGLPAQGAVELSEPWLFAYSVSDVERSVPIRALHLPYGVAWSWSLPVAANEFYDGREIAMPAVSENCVALAMPLHKSGGSPLETVLLFLDKRAGRKLDLRALGGPLTGARTLELRGLGDALFIVGRSPTGRGTGLEVLETLR